MRNRFKTHISKSNTWKLSVLIDHSHLHTIIILIIKIIVNNRLIIEPRKNTDWSEHLRFLKIATFFPLSWINYVYKWVHWAKTLKDQTSVTILSSALASSFVVTHQITVDLANNKRWRIACTIKDAYVLLYNGRKVLVNQWSFLVHEKWGRTIHQAR